MTADLERTSGRTVELDIGGMTCASCAARIEKKLNRMPGVEATVNYATEKARLTLPDDLGADDAIATVVATGYTATVPSPRQTAVQADGGRVPVVAGGMDPTEASQWRQRLLVCTVLTVPVVILAMVPAFQFPNWQWLSLTLASPVVVWGAWPFHRAAWTNARHAT